MSFQKNKYFSSLLGKRFPNDGWIETKLTSEAMKQIKECIKGRSSKSYNEHLAGNISQSFTMEDKDGLFEEKLLPPLIEMYFKEFGRQVVPTILTRDCPFILERLWVNFQKKYEFNPSHTHKGIFSFVIWVTIPTHYKKEHALKFASHSYKAQASDFQFIHISSLGRLEHWSYVLSPKDEGTMLFFPAQLTHQVFPFYTSNKTRVSVSGNLVLDVSHPHFHLFGRKHT